ncbi:class I SAM-dependent methyltransferase [Streptomyces sp. SP18CS02]|uniref:class I SAM-dependent methyltransferase n=1 Tax=Streptomyces sp. SP18CS02 TaxID=3002531 RepID=UPI002E7A9D4C|nr:methyltransferase domain-containing protein [Streptomyces sp. SP18CS02]MEE1752855.1 methyltransferase domain-containing protein [Streptomyces sp. SP18CS02]
MTQAPRLPGESAAEVFDEVGARYEEVFADVPGQLAALDWLTGRLAPGAGVLDVGSGTGRPTAEALVRAGFDVTGIDVSAEMVRLARERVPDARFEQADVRTYRAPDGGFDAVCAFFPLLMMDQPEVARSLSRIASWVAPGGAFVMATVPGDISGLEFVWMGHQITVSSLADEDQLRLLEEAGLEVVHHHTALYHPRGQDAEPEQHLYVHAVRPS